MPNRPIASDFRVSRRLSRHLLLAGVSAFALLAAGTAQAGNIMRPGAMPAVVAAQAQAQAAAAQAAAAGQQARQSLATATQIVQAMQATQSQARNLAIAATSTVPDGLGTGGLDFIQAQNAAAPVQTTSNGQTTVSIQQTDTKAILDWTTFNVGKKTTVDFLQQDSSWVALNRVTDPNARPSQILGQINAPGMVYIVNPNGIIFGGGSQVNVHALIASVLDVGQSGSTQAQRDQFFLANGIASGSGFSFSSALIDPSTKTSNPALVETDNTGGISQIAVEPGAQITTNVVAPDSPGFVYLFGPQVSNAGTITSPEGEVALVGARTITLNPGLYSPADNLSVGSSILANFRGTGFAITPYVQPSSNTFIPGTGIVRNDGLIATPSGTTILNGDAITMSGVISADTSIDRNSAVFLDAVSSVDITGTISAQAVDDGTVLPLLSNVAAQGGSTVQTFVPATIEASAYNVTMESGSLISAPGASVALTGIGANIGNFKLKPSNSAAPEMVTMAPGAIIDVSGLQDVPLPASYNIVSFQARASDFADEPLQRDGPLVGQTLYIDIRDTGTRSDGTTWIGTPLLDASGYVALKGQSIDQLLTNAGTVNIQTELVTKLSTVNLQAGSLINTAGGYVEFLPGMIQTTRLIGSDGHIYNISQADANITYVGIAGQFSINHPRWGITETFTNPILAGQVFEPDYIEGHNAGSLSIASPTPIGDPTFLTGAIAGQRQIAAGTLPSQGSFSLTTSSSLDIGSMDDSSGADAASTFAANLLSTNLSNISITANAFTLGDGSGLTVAAGGSISVTSANTIDIEGSMVAHGGQINLTTDGFGLLNQTGFTHLGGSTATDDVQVGATGLLDVSGRWVNDAGLASNALNGPAYINGGSISLVTKMSNNGGSGASSGADTTGNIIVAAGGVLDASSGGYINQRGALKMASPLVPAGQGGNITLATYQGPDFNIQGNGAPNIPKAGSSVATITLDGTLVDYGFSRGGTLNLTAPTIHIGAQHASAPGALNLSSGFFSSGGFANYVLQSVDVLRLNNNAVQNIAGQVALGPGEELLLRQQNFSNTFDYEGIPTGAKLDQIAPLVTLPTDLRGAVNLTVNSRDILLDSGSSVVADPQAKIALNGDQTSSAVLLGSITDHGGSLSVASGFIWLGSSADLDFSGTFIANSNFGQALGVAQSGTLLPGGSVSFDTSAGQAVSGSQTPGFVIGETGAVIDVSGAGGVVIGQTRHAGLTSDNAVSSWSDAGTVSINAGGFFWDGTFKADAGGPLGNGGTLVLGGTNLVLAQDNSSIQQALDFIANFANQQPLTNANLGSLYGIISGTSFGHQDFASVDHLGAFDTVYLYSGVGSKALFTSATDAQGNQLLASPAPLVINGNVDWTVRNRLYLKGNSLVAGTATQTDDLSASYILLSLDNTKGQGVPPQLGSDASILNISADTIDIQSAALSRFRQANFFSTGDIRLSTPPVPGSSATSTFFGRVASAGDMTFAAQRIYPVSDVDFEIISTSPDGIISFAPAAGPSGIPETPLSAGGSLTVSASQIIQNGNLYAPLGQITLGAQTAADLSPNDPNQSAAGYFVPTNTVTLGAGSITSVSLSGMSVPFGQTEDGTNWFYFTDAAPLAAPPAKAIRLLGQNVTTDAQATLDLSGGGDLQAMEFVPGKGGSRDVLTTGANGQAVYALVPSQKDPVAAFDLDFVDHLGDTQPLVGQQIYLAGGNGIAAGYYTLYPSHYATLPGAYRVVDYGSALTMPGTAGATLPDGTQLIGGYYAQSSLGLRSSTPEIFAVQSSAVWRQYSEIDNNTANAYFTAKAVHDGVVTPPLPMDAGRLAISALTSLNLGAIAQAQAAPGGRGGELDISAPKIDLIGPQETAAAGYLGVEVSQLDASGFQSILIGGRRSDVIDGTLITPTASAVQLDSPDLALAAPEIILAAKAATTLETLPGGDALQFAVPSGGAITVSAGSTLAAAGDVTSTLGRNYILGSAGNLATTLASDLGGTVDSTGTVINNVDKTKLTSAALSQLTHYGTTVALAGALVVSDDPGVTVTRPISQITINFTDGSTSLVLPVASGAGNIAVGAGAQLNSGHALFLSAAQMALDPQAGLNAKAIDITTSSIVMGNQVTRQAGLIISSALANELAAANSLTLRSLGGGISFDGAFNFDSTGTNLTSLVLDTAFLTGNGGNVTVASDGTITLTNTGATISSSAPTNAGANFTLNANEIDFGGGNQTIAGFDTVAWNASSEVVVRGSGALTLGANTTPVAFGDSSAVDFSQTAPVNFLVTTPTLVAGTNAQLAVTLPGAFTLQRPGGAAMFPIDTSQVGGGLQIVASSIDDRGTIAAVAGTVTLHAAGSGGDVAVGDGAEIDAGGFAQAFFDVTKYAPGGKVVLTADAGNVVTTANSIIDLSQPSGGLASGGELDVNAGAGSAEIDGTILAAGGPGHGGVFQLKAQQLGPDTSLDSLAAILQAGGVTGAIDIETSRGNLVLSAGQHLVAQSVSLTADDSTSGNGRVIINGEIDAQGYGGTTADGLGEAGGSVNLYGYNWVSLGSTAAILATTTHSDQRGGDVTLGIAAGAEGLIDLQAGSLIDVSGGSAGGLSNGTILLRAPIVSSAVTVSGINGGSDALLGYDPDPSQVGNDVRVGSLGGSMAGARSITVEDYVTISTSTNQSLDKGSITVAGWDGIIDPAGVYSNSGQHIEGVWRDANSNIVGYELGGQRYVYSPGSNSPVLDSDQNDSTGTFQAGTLTLSGGVPIGFTACNCYNTNHITFYQNTVASFVQGLVPNFGFSKAQDRLGTGVQIQPGVVLDNPDSTVNGGNITVASNWNLAAGIAVDGNGTPLASGATFNAASDAIKFLYRYGLEPGALTLRAAGSVDINASISDGFFQFANYEDPTYVATVQALNFTTLNTIGGNSTSTAYYWLPLSSLPSNLQAPYDPTANGVSPSSLALASADLFPSQMQVKNNLTGTVAPTDEGSWTYRITAGAQFASANPGAVQTNSSAGDVVVNGHFSYTDTTLRLNASKTVNLPTLLRTGMGAIAINAARDVVLADQLAPGAIYTGGLNMAVPDGYKEPQLLAYGGLTNSTDPAGPLTAAAFAQEAGDITINAQRDIVGYQNVTGASVSTQYQFYAPWLISMAEVPFGTTNALLGSGVFASSSAEQSSWWIEFGAFDQGVLSAGGNVTVNAGRDMRDFSVSLPSTGRVSGGTVAGNMPVLHAYGSGDLVVDVGRNLYSGSFYEGSGGALVKVVGSVGADWVSGQSASSGPVSTVLAVDSGAINVFAGGSIAISDIINPAELHVQNGTASSGTVGTSLFMDTYGPDSAVNLATLTGDVTVRSNLALLDNSSAAGTQTYPAMLGIAAFNGSITMPQTGLIQTSSVSGALDLLAQQNLDFTGGVAHTANNASTYSPSSSGASLIDTAFNPYEPNNGFGGAVSDPVLAHGGPGEDQPDHLYAVSGNLTGGGIMQIAQPVEVEAGQNIVDLNLTAQNIAAKDISSVIAGHDLFYTGFANFGGLQIAGPGFLLVEAGRDLGPFLPAGEDTSKTAFAAEGVVSSGNAATYFQSTGSLDFPVGNAPQLQPIGLPDSEFIGTLNVKTSQRSGAQNFKLPTTGASIVSLFGLVDVVNGPDYQALISTYIDPSNAASASHNYLSELQAFLSGVGIAAASPADAWREYQRLNPRLQDIFALEVYFDELKATADASSPSYKQYSRGYQAVNTLFPASHGYTANDLGGGANGANQLIPTGDLDLLHATIQTDQGGNIMLLGPGGNILVGSTASEPNPNLKPNNLGILTLDGGNIDTFTDESVLVNTSRIFTEEGGDIVMWSSNGDLDAGRGKRTTISFPPLVVTFNQDDYERPNPGGLVTGAGIATLQASPFAPPSDAFLATPRGTVDAGDAGLRVSGNLSIAALLVAHANYIEVQGKATGVPTVAAPNTGALSAAANSSAATADAAEEAASQSRKNGSGQALPSIITVEVLGYGGAEEPSPTDEKNRRKP